MQNQEFLVADIATTYQKSWNFLQKQYQMTDEQLQKFITYTTILLQENQKYNLTAIVDVDAIILDHFVDSLILLKKYDVATLQSLIDVGSGAGFPGIPLAIMLPQVAIELIEVNLKKVNFLKLVIAALDLRNVIVHEHDWRTFLRSRTSPADVVIARASLQVEELLRMFQGSSALQKGILIYWASKKWVPTLQEKEYLNNCVDYVVGQKSRKLCFFRK